MIASTTYLADIVLLPSGWARDVLLQLAPTGDFASVLPEASPGSSPCGTQRLRGAVLPGMPNVHSHAFQRAVAGRAEMRERRHDTFWSWRESMYSLLTLLEPTDVRAVSQQVYVEMLKAGYTSVGEFHYLHNDRNGGSYSDHAEMSWAVLEAAQAAGIGITHLPVLYQRSGFGRKAPSGGQRRFAMDVEDLLRMTDSIRTRHVNDPQVRVGIAPHSLRAIQPQALKELVDGMDDIDRRAPVHIHVAEQLQEVSEGAAHLGCPPLQWLLDHAPVDERWCLIHSLHMTQRELSGLVERNAVIGICPTTEANLGDGTFPLVRLLRSGGRYGVGSDSNSSVCPVEELRWLEYSQRLKHRRRHIAAGLGRSCGAELYRSALAGGAAALGRRVGAIEPGYRADLVVLDRDHPQLLGHEGDRLLDAFVFSGNERTVRDVMVGGRWVVRDKRHRMEVAAARAFGQALRRLGLAA